MPWGGAESKETNFFLKKTRWSSWCKFIPGFLRTVRCNLSEKNINKFKTIAYSYRCHPRFPSSSETGSRAEFLSYIALDEPLWPLWHQRSPQFIQIVLQVGWGTSFKSIAFGACLQVILESIPESLCCTHLSFKPVKYSLEVIKAFCVCPSLAILCIYFSQHTLTDKHKKEY